MSRREWVACVGATLGLLAAHRAPAWLIASNGWSELVLHEPATARYVYGLLVVPLPFVGAILACALLNFAEVHGVAGPQRRRRRPLPPYPFDPHKTQLVIGETHQQDGSLSEQPDWLVLPEKGMYTGVLITGATGSAKTSAAQYPFTAQLIHLHADDPARKMGGLIIDAKGNYADFVRLAAAMKFSVAVELASLRYATPTTKRGGAGVSGRIFNRGPVKQSKS